MSDITSVDAPAPEPAPVSAAPPRRRARGLIIAVVLLSLALVGAASVAVWNLVQLHEAASIIRDQDRELLEKDRELERQRELIDRKDTFGAAIDELLGEVAAYEGIPLDSLIPWDDYQSLTWQAWSRRWDAEALTESIAAVQRSREALATKREAAEAEAAVNASGSVYEATFDRLGFGFVDWRFHDADALCGGDVLACVISDEPLIVHVDAVDDAHPSMTDWIRTGIAYHEFAHVLQLTNPAPTEAALEAFDGDREWMADCFALTYLDGWTLDHRVWVSSNEYWDLSVGYGRTCDASQQQVVREWRESLGVTLRQLGPGVTS